MTLESNTIREFVKDLEEVYQPIYKHPHLSNQVSRICEDRFAIIQDVFKCLDCTNKPLRVLDLGCAQGYFSFSLAEMGAEVVGIDYLEKNISLCKVLQLQNKLLSIDFIHGNIEDLLEEILRRKFDIVLGLSIFHHVIYTKGIDYTVDMLTAIFNKSQVSLFEFAGKREGIYWCDAQPESHEILFKQVQFFHKIAEFNTHLSSWKRPFYFASNQYLYLNKKLWSFETYKNQPHKLSNNVYKNSRHYYFDKDYIVKYCKLIPLTSVNSKWGPNMKSMLGISRVNLMEHKQELDFLKKVTGLKNFPRIIDYGINETSAWIIREKIDGQLLLDVILRGDDFNAKKVIENVLDQLVYLEGLGLYHNDIRLWNVLIDKKGNCNIIDYGSISSEKGDRVWPHENFWSFLVFVGDVTSRKSSYANVKESTPLLNNFVRLPSALRIWFSEAFALPKYQLSYKKLMALYYEYVYKVSDSADFSADRNCYMNVIEEASYTQLKETNYAQLKKANYALENMGLINFEKLKKRLKPVLAIIYASCKFIKGTLLMLRHFFSHNFMRLVHAGRRKFMRKNKRRT